MNKTEAITFLRENPVFFSTLGFCYDPPMKNAMGKPLVFNENLDQCGAYHRNFGKAGVMIHSSILHSGWIGVEEYDYSLTDRVLEEIFKDNPDIYYIPRVKLNVPVDWCYENPEEVFVYHGGPRTIEEIRSLVGTLKHDYIGYEAPNGYYTAGFYKDERPNVGGLIAMQSFSSKKWLEDAGKALCKLLDRLENSKYAERILGYHIAYGASGECVLWGRSSNRYGDYGIANKKAFYNWGLKKYQSKEVLSKVWQQPDISEDHIEIPSPEERYAVKDTVETFFRKKEEQRICCDFDEFISDVNVEAIEYFAKLIKEKAPDKLTGAFYGYIMEVDNSAYTGHLAIEKLLDSPYVDFLAAPKSYYRCKAGEPGGVLCPSMSINHKKLWIDELDNRTHLAQNVEKNWEANGFQETRTVMWRELAKNFANDSGFWWMDLGVGWFESDELMSEISKMVKVNNAIRMQKKESESDILMLVDEECIGNMNISSDLRSGFMQDLQCELRMTGCLADVYRLRDLEWLELSKYKLIMFAYTYKISEKQVAFIQNISPNTTIIFHYASGIICGEKCSLENVKRLTGVCLQPSKDGRFDFPQLEIVEQEGLEKLGMDDHGSIKLAAIVRGNGGRNVVNTLPYIDHVQLRKIADMAGCHGYVPAGNILYGDNRFLGVFSTEKAQVEIVWKRAGDYRNVLTSEFFENVKTLPIKLEKNGAAFLLKM